MNYRFYNDSRKNYLVISCSREKKEAIPPEEEDGILSFPFLEREREQGAEGTGTSAARSLEAAETEDQTALPKASQTSAKSPDPAVSEDVVDYQYRMIAANKIEGLLPCSLRRINGELLLYVDITSLQSMESLFRGRRMNGAAQKKILYSLAAAGDSISRFLLDSRKILMDPQFIFYSYARDGWYFVYYPQEGEGGLHKLLQFMADRTDPMDKRAAAAIYQLCSMADGRNFILNSHVLDRLYAQNSGQAGMEMDQFRESSCGMGPDHFQTDSNSLHQNPAYDSAAFREENPRADHAQNQNTRFQNPPQYSPENPPEKGPAEDGQPDPRLSQVLIGAFICLVAAAGAEFLHVRFQLAELPDLAARAVAACGMAGCVLLACYGVLLAWRRKSALGQQNSTEEQPMMQQTLDFRRSQLCGGIRTGSMEAPQQQVQPSQAQNWQAQDYHPQQPWQQEQQGWQMGSRSPMQ